MILRIQVLHFYLLKAKAKDEALDEAKDEAKVEAKDEAKVEAKVEAKAEAEAEASTKLKNVRRASLQKDALFLFRHPASPTERLTIEYS